MKLRLILFIAFIVNFSIKAQETIFINGLPKWTSKFELVGNDLYVVNSADAGSIIKIDINNPGSIFPNIITGLNNPSDIAIINGFAYVSVTNEVNLVDNINFNLGKIVRFDLSQENPSAEDVLTNLNFPTHLQAVGDELHFFEQNILSLAPINRNSKISKINVTDTNPTAETYVTNLGNGVTEFIIDKNDIYINRNTGLKSKILKGDITKNNNDDNIQTYLSGNFASLNSMVIFENKLYFNYVNRRTENNFNHIFIASVDLMATHVTATDIKPLSIGSTGWVCKSMVFDSAGDLLLLETVFDMVLKITNETLSTVKLDKNLYSIYPNPVKEVVNINLSNKHILKKTSVQNIFGKTLISSNLKTIDISKLSSGVYLLKIETNDGLVALEKIIKE